MVAVITYTHTTPQPPVHRPPLPPYPLDEFVNKTKLLRLDKNGGDTFRPYTPNGKCVVERLCVHEEELTGEEESTNEPIINSRCRPQIVLLQ